MGLSLENHIKEPSDKTLHERTTIVLANTQEKAQS